MIYKEIWFDYYDDLVESTHVDFYLENCTACDSVSVQNYVLQPKYCTVDYLQPKVLPQVDIHVDFS